MRTAREINKQSVTMFSEFGPPTTGGGQFEVRIGTKEGLFCFRVRTQREADHWCSVIESHIHEYLGVCDDKANGKHSRGTVSNGRQRITDRKRQMLQKIWRASVRRASLGLPPTDGDLAELFALYDSSPDNNLEIGELESMMCDLNDLRLTNLKAFLQELEAMTRQSGHSLFDNTKQRGRNMKLQQLAMHMLRKYEDQASEEKVRMKLLVMHSKLDVTRDGFICLGEFLKSAPIAIFGQQELALEAEFYNLGGATENEEGRRAGKLGEDGGCSQS